jgi:hypothetical protein
MNNLIGMTLISLLIGSFYMLYQESQYWEKYKTEHHCEVVAHVSGQVFNTINTNGTIGVGSTAPQTGYKCDDGVTYYR